MRSAPTDAPTTGAGSTKRTVQPAIIGRTGGDCAPLRFLHLPGAGILPGLNSLLKGSMRKVHDRAAPGLLAGWPVMNPGGRRGWLVAIHKPATCVGSLHRGAANDLAAVTAGGAELFDNDREMAEATRVAPDNPERDRCR